MMHTYCVSKGLRVVRLTKIQGLRAVLLAGAMAGSVVYGEGGIATDGKVGVGQWLDNPQSLSGS
ncbi:MAG: hypothetical protein ABL925_05580, partial [Methylococcales bacterium]